MVCCRQLVLVGVVVSFVFAMGGATVAQTVRIDLPELLGPQSVSVLDTTDTSLARSVTIPKSTLPLHFDSLRFEWSGTIKAGRIVGDGLERAPIERFLRGNFGSLLEAPGFTYGFLPAVLPEFGPFESSWQLDAPIGALIDYNCINCDYLPEVYTLKFKLGPDFFSLGDSIPFLNPADEGELRFAHQGLIMLEGIEANVTSAALVFDLVPEPVTASLVLSGLGWIVASGARLRRLK